MGNRVMGPKRGKILKEDSVPSVFSGTVRKTSRHNVKEKMRKR